MSNEHGNSTMKSALVLGATGAVGKALLKDLLKNSHYDKVITVGRRNAELDNTIPQEKLVQKTVDFENLDASREAFQNVNDVYCCLGTTRKDAGSAERFKKIDQDYVLESARLVVAENPVKDTTTSTHKSPVHFLYCSSVGANKNSWFLYPQSKGETEERLGQAGFEKVSIFQPAILETETPRANVNPVSEAVLGVISRASHSLSLHYSISVVDVGRAMHLAATSPVPPYIKPPVVNPTSGSHVYYFSNKDMERMVSTS